MTEYCGCYNQSEYRLTCASALEQLKDTPDDCVDCVITSPPYWQLRDYGAPPLVWESSDRKLCSHRFDETVLSPRGGKCHPDRPANTGANRHMSESNLRGVKQTSEFCIHCGAWKGQLGLEPTTQLFIDHLVLIFDEVLRVLKKGGTFWLNLGDSYSGSNMGRGTRRLSKKQATNRGSNHKKNWPGSLVGENLPPKNLCGIPWRTALALQERGWILRQDIIWHKPNGMPESVKDRCTRAHEYLFLLVKNPRYYFDYEAIKVQSKQGEMRRRDGVLRDRECQYNSKLNILRRSKNLLEKEIAEKLIDRYKNRDRKGRKHSHTSHIKQVLQGEEYNAGKVHKRSVWSIPIKGFKEAHFAVFPPQLIEPCVLAGCPPCGWVLDPFCGAGTTGIVSLKNGRNFWGIELNSDYVELAERRIRNYELC